MNITEKLNSNIDNESDEWGLMSLIYDMDFLDPTQQELQAIHKKLKCVPLVEWICTDTPVGQHAYLFNGKLVATSIQECRKCDTHFTYVDNSSYRELNLFIHAQTNRSLDIQTNKQLGLEPLIKSRENLW